MSGVISASGTNPDPGTDVGDVDLWRFTVMAGQKVGFDIDRAWGNLDSYIRVFTDAGNQVGPTMIGWAVPEGSSGESYLGYTFVQAGTYYVGVSGFNNSNYNPVTGDGDVSGSARGGTR